MLSAVFFFSRIWLAIVPIVFFSSPRMELLLHDLIVEIDSHSHCLGCLSLAQWGNDNKSSDHCFYEFPQWVRAHGDINRPSPSHTHTRTQIQTFLHFLRWIIIKLLSIEFLITLLMRGASAFPTDNISHSHRAAVAAAVGRVLAVQSNRTLCVGYSPVMDRRLWSSILKKLPEYLSDIGIRLELGFAFIFLFNLSLWSWLF